MDIKRPLVIGYSGSLAFYDPSDPLFRNSGWKDWFWTYHHLSTDPSTRSAYFLFKALKYIREESKWGGEAIQVHMWGVIDPRNIAQAKEMGIFDMIRFEGYLPKERSIQKLASCDLLFLPFESASEKGKPLFIPGKLFEYLKVGKPVLALGGSCDGLDILQRSGLGLIFEPEETKAIASRLTELCNDQTLLKSYVPDNEYISNYSSSRITGQVSKVFDEVLNRK
jgi:glycosyltransferase involved in cell wall biosynthesis